MSESILNILDNDYTKASPCKGCHWHIQGIEKNRCVKICQRLKAYREGHEYNHLPWPKLEDLQDVQGGHPVIEDKIPLKPSLTKSKIKVAAIKKVYADPPIPKPQKPKRPNRDKVFKLYVSKYPEIMQYIVETAERSLLPAKDVFVQLLSEAITARKENDK